jgi:phage gpG-like protein
MSDNKFHLGQVLTNIQRMKQDLPRLLANQAQRHFADSWKEQGFEGTPWKEVQRRIPGTSAYKYPMKKGLARRTRAILVKSGELRRKVSMSVRTVSWEITRLVVDLPYAAAHNEGTTTAGRGHNVTIPARPSCMTRLSCARCKGKRLLRQ